MVSEGVNWQRIWSHGGLLWSQRWTFWFLNFFTAVTKCSWFHLSGSSLLQLMGSTQILWSYCVNYINTF